MSRLDTYVGRICVGSFVVCIGFLVGLFVLIDLVQHLEKFAGNLERLPDEWKRLGFLLIGAYYLSDLPFIYLLVAPFVTVTSGMFAVSRLMNANEVVPMVFTGRRVQRILLPVFAMAVCNTGLMVGLRELVLPTVVSIKDDLHDMLATGSSNRTIRDKVIRLANAYTLFFDEYQVQSQTLLGVNLCAARQQSWNWIEARKAQYRENGDRGAGWYLEGGRSTYGDSGEGEVIAHLPPDAIPGFDPDTLRSRLKERQELMDSSYTSLIALVRENPNVLEYSVALHHHLTFPLANVLLLLLALPFALRFERGSNTECVVFAILVGGAYLVVDLIFQNLGRQGIMHPVLAAWFPSILFGSLGIVMFDTVRT